MFFITLLIILIYTIIVLGSIGLLIWTIVNRRKEKNREKEEHKDYKDY